MNEMQSPDPATSSKLENNSFESSRWRYIAPIAFCLAMCWLFVFSVFSILDTTQELRELKDSHGLLDAVRVTGLEGTRLSFDTVQGEMATTILHASGLPKPHAGQVFNAWYYAPLDHLKICSDTSGQLICYDLDPKAVPKLVELTLKADTAAEMTARIERAKRENTFP